MKTLLSTIVVSLLIVACQKSEPIVTETPPVIDIQKEKESVVAFLENAAEIFISGDIGEIEKLHVGNDEELRITGTTAYKGWSNIKNLIEGYIKTNESDTVSTNIKNMKEDVKVIIRGNIAIAVCNNIWSWENSGEQEASKNTQITVLEKVDGEWKFLFDSYMNQGKELVDSSN